MHGDLHRPIMVTGYTMSVVSSPQMFLQAVAKLHTCLTLSWTVACVIAAHLPADRGKPFTAFFKLLEATCQFEYQEVRRCVFASAYRGRDTLTPPSDGVTEE